MKTIDLSFEADMMSAKPEIIITPAMVRKMIGKYPGSMLRKEFGDDLVNQVITSGNYSKTVEIETKTLTTKDIIKSFKERSKKIGEYIKGLTRKKMVAKPITKEETMVVVKKPPRSMFDDLNKAINVSLTRGYMSAGEATYYIWNNLVKAELLPKRSHWLTIMLETIQQFKDEQKAEAKRSSKKLRSNEAMMRDNDFTEEVFLSDSDGDCIPEVFTKFKENAHVRGSLKSLDSKVSKGRSIDIFRLMEYLAKIHSIRELIYNNRWGIVVKDPEKNNYPEKVVLNTIKNILLENIQKEKYINERRRMYLYAASVGPETVLGKAWATIPSIADNDIDAYTNHHDIDTKERGIPAASGAWESLMCRMTRDVKECDTETRLDKWFANCMYVIRVSKLTSYQKTVAIEEYMHLYNMYCDN